MRWQQPSRRVNCLGTYGYAIAVNCPSGLSVSSRVESRSLAMTRVLVFSRSGEIAPQRDDCDHKGQDQDRANFTCYYRAWPPMNSPNSDRLTVYVVEDDAAMRDSLTLMLGLLGFRTLSFESAEAFLETYRDEWVGCVVADLRLPGMSGIELQADLRAKGKQLPFVIITGHGDVKSARAAFQSDAVDFIEKPFDEAELRVAIEKGFDRESRRIRRVETGNDQIVKLAKLTNREREVLELVGKGLHAKEIAAALGISARTVEVHKARLMTKIEARNVSELVRFAIAADQMR